MSQIIYGPDLVRIHFDSSMSYHIAEELAQAHPKRAFRGIKTELVSPQNFENICKVPYMLEHYFALHHHVIYIHLKCFYPFVTQTFSSSSFGT